MPESATHPATKSEVARRDRLVDLGHKNPRRKRTFTELDARAKLLVEYLTTGCPHPYVSQITRHSPTEDDPERRRPLEPFEPMRLEEAADLLRIRRRHARFIAAQPVFQKALATALGQMRDGHKAEALNKVADIMRAEGDGSAAWAKVNLAAAKEILGEAVGVPPAKPSVNVNVGVGVNLTAGVVIRLPAGLPPTPLESGVEPKSIIDTHPISHERRMITAEGQEPGDDR
jgi:hypothetical protein